ncbi:MAG: hypothetical protein JXB62_03135 [Pirellulales bacterium]|nr:hypothetical protein [Pirellulales bacterium]
MSILVVCPGCHKRFKVSEKFAGKSGTCPSCKGTIRVPTKEEEVKVHAPTAFAEGGRGRSGELLTKPIARRQIRLHPVATVAVAGGVLTVLLVAWAAGGVLQSNLAVRAVGLLLVSLPLVLAAYTFLRDEDLEPYRGRSLCVRAAICSAAYVALWAVYGYLAGTVITGELWEWLFVVPPFLVAGALIALACLDLDFGSGFFHYGFYLLATVLLRWIAGMGWIWEATGAAP